MLPARCIIGKPVYLQGKILGLWAAKTVYSAF